MFTLPSIFFLLLLIGCSELNQEELIEGRNYSVQQVERGKKVYIQHCQSCHGKDATGDSNYEEMAKQGIFLNPPLNSQSMLWHRDFSVIQGQIIKGTNRFEGGKMPAFENQLTKEEINTVIFYLISFWTDETYQRWKDEVNQTENF